MSVPTKTRAKKPYPFIACRPAPPVPDPAEAVRMAVETNPANAVAAAGAMLSVGMIHVLTSKWWGPGGVDLSVQFLDNPDDETVRMILSDEIGMNAWGRYGNVKFRRTTGPGDVRCARDRTGYWANVGTDIRLVPAGQPNLNLQGFTSRTPVPEYKRVVKHEAWHILGGGHEHARQDILDELDMTKTIAVFRRDAGWSPQQTIQQVFSVLAEKSLIATPADPTSIACYQFSGECTKSGKPIPGGADINANDGAFCAKLYPKPDAPPPPPAGVWTYQIDRATGAVTKVS